MKKASHSRSHDEPKEITVGVGSTDGTGNWSNAKKKVHFLLVVPYAFHKLDRRIYGVMNAYFLPEDWNTAKDGLIYTDKGFIKGVRDALLHAGFRHVSGRENLGYSEQGMQGVDFVNFDVGGSLARELVDNGYAVVEDDS